jgi:exodeoxyribonuclease VII large subunit
VEESKYSVGQLVAEINGVLTSTFDDIWVEGEVSGFKAVASGHWYFNLKDPEADATLSCAMFAYSNRSVRVRPKDGDKVLVRGGIDVYAPRGSFSLKCKRLEYTGAGELMRRLEELRKKLAAEGLFDEARKIRVPAFPRAVGVATSPTGAALQDIRKVVAGRWPGLQLYLAPCRVQGDGAAREVAEAVRLLDDSGLCDVILVGRGGGSAEDLFCFNEEPVVRAVAACRTPIISCVGHEIDTTLCDFAADQRAATPSHAAELVTPDRDALAVQLDDRFSRLERAVRRRVNLLRERVTRVRIQHPAERITRGRIRCEELDGRAHAAMLRLVARRREQARGAARALDALSPLRVLDRGYSIALRQGVAVTDASTLKAGDKLELRFARGRAEATVKGTNSLF